MRIFSCQLKKRCLARSIAGSAAIRVELLVSRSLTSRLVTRALVARRGGGDRGIEDRTSQAGARPTSRSCGHASWGPARCRPQWPSTRPRRLARSRPVRILLGNFSLSAQVSKFSGYHNSRGRKRCASKRFLTSRIHGAHAGFGTPAAPGRKKG